MSKSQPARSRLLKNAVCRLLKEISQASARSGALEYWNIGILGFERINPSFHPSTIPSLTTLERSP